MIEHYSSKIQNTIQKELFTAKSSIKIAVAWFTNDLLFQPLLLKLQTGVKVELILNKDDINLSSENDVDFDAFIQAGGLLHWNETKQLMHDKLCIIDDLVVITGSYNWTNKAEYNDESITIFREETSTVTFYKNKFEILALKYPSATKNEDHAHCDKTNTICPAGTIPKPYKYEPYSGLNFYDDIQIKETGIYGKIDNKWALLDATKLTPISNFVDSPK